MSHKRRSRPGWATGAASKSISGDVSSTAILAHGPVVRGAVVIDLRIEDDNDQLDHQITRAIQSAVLAPAGAEITFVVRPGQYPPVFPISYVMEHGTHLGCITVQCCDPATIWRWVAALRVPGEVF